VNFAKLHGAGNDFLLFDGRSDPSLADALPTLVSRLCHRRFGLGADGVLLLKPAGPNEARVVYWNADGSEVAFCANATRCAARFAAERWRRAQWRLRRQAGRVRLQRLRGSRRPGRGPRPGNRLSPRGSPRRSAAWSKNTSWMPARLPAAAATAG
jgi:diaminopimelate epimerase